jgi:hypothetical protein
MLLSADVRAQLCRERGVYVTEACDRCGQLLGPVRFTRRDDRGVWCSRLCRDGRERRTDCEVCTAPLRGKRVGSIFCSDRCQKRKSRNVQDTQIIADTHIQNKALADAISA